MGRITPKEIEEAQALVKDVSEAWPDIEKRLMSYLAPKRKKTSKPKKGKGG